MTSDWLEQSWLLFAVGSYWFLNIAFPWQEACWQMTWVWEKLCSQQFCYSIFEIKARWIQISWFLSGRCGIGRLATATAELWHSIFHYASLQFLFQHSAQMRQLRCNIRLTHLNMNFNDLKEPFWRIHPISPNWSLKKLCTTRILLCNNVWIVELWHFCHMLRLHQRRNTSAGGCTFFSAKQLANRTGVLCQMDLGLMQSVAVSSHSLDSICSQDLGDTNQRRTVETSFWCYRLCFFSRYLQKFIYRSIKALDTIFESANLSRKGSIVGRWLKTTNVLSWKRCFFAPKMDPTDFC